MQALYGGDVPAYYNIRKPNYIQMVNLFNQGMNTIIYGTWDANDFTTALDFAKSNNDFQKEVYNYIRQQDLESLKRPIIIANTMWAPQGQQVNTDSLSAQAQDVMFLDQYSADSSIQNTWYNIWKQYALVSFVPVLPAFSNSSCTSAVEDTYKAVSAAIQQQGLQSYYTGGLAYFAFSPIHNNPSDFTLSIDNCPEMFKTRLPRKSVLNFLPLNAKLLGLPKMHSIA